MRARFCAVFGMVALSLGSVFLWLQRGLDTGAGSTGNDPSGDLQPNTTMDTYSPRWLAGGTTGIPFNSPVEPQSPEPSHAQRDVSAGGSIDGWAEALFRRLDQNGDGLLNVDEMPKTLRATRDRWGADEDDLISLAAFKRYFRTRVRQARRHLSGLAADAVAENSPTNEDVAEYPLTLKEGLPGAARQGDSARQRRVQSYEAGTSRVHDPSGATQSNGSSPSPLADQLPTAKPGSRQVAGIWSRRLSPDQLERGYVVTAALASSARPGMAPVKTGNSSAASAPAPRRVPAAAPVAPRPSPALLAASPAPAAGPVPDPDYLATVPLPINDGSNARWTAREQENETRLRLGHAPVLFLGDSITDALAAGAGTPVWDTYYAPLGMEDFAIGGLTTSQVLWQVRTGQVAALRPEVVVLMIGTNNLALGQSPGAVASGITKIVDEIQAQSEQTRVLLLGIFPRGQTPAEPLRQSIAQVNARIAALDDGGRVRYLDFGDNFLQPDGMLSPLVMPDFLHPSELGYLIYTASVWTPLVELLEAGP